MKFYTAVFVMKVLQASYASAQYYEDDSDALINALIEAFGCDDSFLGLVTIGVCFANILDDLPEYELYREAYFDGFCDLFNGANQEFADCFAECPGVSVDNCDGADVAAFDDIAEECGTEVEDICNNIFGDGTKDEYENGASSRSIYLLAAVMTVAGTF